ncbi:hypothetical protein F5X96DRAFT_664962 [Biscogniauxia mediterranea]|nr:hypothetical protein F5X96DRAFT_664962 [Biscogniauxia mediterranea]
MPYSLAIYHLDYIRRRLNPDIKVVFIPEVSCSGTSRFRQDTDGLEHSWSSDVYFNKELLGPATDQSIPRWTPLLMELGIHHLSEEFTMYRRVWCIAHEMGRLNLQEVPYGCPAVVFLTSFTLTWI